MPTLTAEPELFPLELFSDEGVPELQLRRWCLLHTRPRQEKALARQLHAAQVPFYLPLIQRRRLLRGQPVTSYLPLFPGYAFLLGTTEERLQALATRRVAAALPVAEQDRLWRDLRQIQRLIASGEPISPEDRLAPGSLVEIRSGPLAGLRGKIIDRASRRRFIVEVDFIQRGASVVLDDFTVVGVTS
jgi:transcriptional antiterminator RfaH